MSSLLYLAPLVSTACFLDLIIPDGHFDCCLQVLDDIDLKFKLATSGVGENFAEDLASGARRPQRASGYSLLKQVCLSAL